jgi:predicted phosphodiesterase
MRRRFQAADAVVFSHLPLHESEDGFQVFNPGSPTERRRAPRPSMGLLTDGRADWFSSTSGSNPRFRMFAAGKR